MAEGIKEKHRGGRPKKTNKKAFFFSIRVNQEERFVLKEKARQAGCPVSFYIRQSALMGKIVSRFSRDDHAVFRQLAGMAQNLNQLTKAFHRDGILKTAMQIEIIRNQIQDVLTQIKR